MLVLASLCSLQHQVDMLVCQQDSLEMHNRRKILLLHGVSEDKNEDIKSVIVDLVTQRLKVPNFKNEDIDRCHRLGKFNPDNARPILFKDHDTSLRGEIWSLKSNLKDSGLTLSEFLSKLRHDTFMEARSINKCWTRDGTVYVMTADGKRHRVTCLAELDKVSAPRAASSPEPSAVASNISAAANTIAVKEARPRRVGCEVASTTRLVDYLRHQLELRGTKYMCREGGCGACVVAAVKCPGGPVLAVNSCMVSITSCEDWEILTIEGLGNRNSGYHVLQRTLADHNGTQCGYCSPAWVMNMYSLVQNGNKPTMLEIENSFGGNVCRCTGYRPILDAFKTLAMDAPKSKLSDIEDLTICKKNGTPCDKSNCDDEGWCILDAGDSKTVQIKLKDDKCWYKVWNLGAILDILNNIGSESYMLVFGNTARGAYPIDDYPNVLIDITSVAELKTIEMDQNLIIGAGLTLTELLNVFKTTSRTEYFGYLKRLYKHLLLVANIPVRNLGSIAGNLMIKHQHNDFASDLFLLLETVGACMTIVNARNESKKLTMQQFLTEDMKGKVILNVLFPPLNDSNKLYTYKTMPRAQNAHAIVNAGFLFKLTPNNDVVTARIVYGGLSPSCTRAVSTEKFLQGKPLFTNSTLQSALNILKNEMLVTPNLPEPSVEYRRHLALALFYKALLYLCPETELGKRYSSGRARIHDERPVSEGVQTFDTNSSLWPLNQPIPKIDGLIQCAGEAKYSEDQLAQPNEVYAAFALSTVALGDIVKIDASRALNMRGVLKFYTAADIPGVNSFTPAGTTFYTANEEVLCSGKVLYFNQPIGIVVAETQHIADTAAKLVTATYKNTKLPEIDVREIVNDPNRLTLNFSSEPTARGDDVENVIKGEYTFFGQYHFMMENLSCVTRPTEEGLEIFTTSQWIDGVQVMVSKALNIEESRVDVHMRRVGGGFGMKISRSIQVAVGASLVTLKMNRPCRLVVPLTTATRAIGKRLPCHSQFECGVNSSGVIQHLDYNLYEDNGYKVNETLTALATGVFSNGYDLSRWNFKCYDAITDNAKNTWCRSPGTLEAIASAEHIMEHIAYKLSLDPCDVRMANLDTEKYKDLKEMTETLKSTASYTTRKAAVATFNEENRWRKRGLRFSTVRWTTAGAGILTVNLSVFHADGTVIINHGAVEMGQGINTKIIQILAYMLKIPVSKIQVKANSTITNPNCFISGGSLSSQNAGLGAIRCAEELLSRLKPIRLTMTNPTWEELIAKAFEMDVDLQVHGYVGAKDAMNYDIFGVSLAEVEVDVLTGESEVLRVDILQDVGQSVSPEIDIGQIEGAFIMGLGYWTSEHLVYASTGELLTDRSWNYHVPLARDIPRDLRVSFRKNSYGYPQYLGAKATGEPPMCLSVVVAFALRAAVADARRESGIPTTDWFRIDGPYTVETLALAAASKMEDFKLI